MTMLMKGILDMARLPVAVIGGIAAAAGLIATAPGASLMIHGLVALVMTLVIGAGFVINDYFDVEKDRINYPGRPIPQGRVTRRQALVAAILMFAGAIVAAMPLGWPATALVILDTLALALYSRVRLINGLIGNLITAFLCASIVLLGGLVGTMTPGLIAPASFIFGLILMREVVFDIHDVPGDAAVGMRTLPIVAGADMSFRVAWATVAALAAGTVGIGFSDLIQHKALFIGFLLAGLALISRGLWLYDRSRSEVAYNRFCLDGRWCFLVVLPGLVAGAMN